MAVPKTILDYATNRRATAEQALIAAQQRLAITQSDLAVVNIEANNSAAALADLERRAAEIRQNLSAIVTPADGVALLGALEQTIIRIRAKQATIVKTQGRFSVAQADAARAQTDLAAASADLAAAGAAVDQATQSHTDRDAWANALSSAPLATIHTEAGKALDDANPDEGAAFKTAKERIEADVPAKLLERAHDRRAQAAALISQIDKSTKDAEDAGLKEHEDHGGLAGLAAKSWVAFQRAENAARDFVNTAEAGFDQAISRLVEVGDRDRLPLTAEQRARIHDATMEPDREPAADAEATLDTGVAKDLSDKHALLDDAILKAKADPNPVTTQAVSDARIALTAAQTAFNTANQLWREKETLLAAAVEGVEIKETALGQAIQEAVAAGSDPDADPDVALARSELTTAQNNLKSAEDAYKTSEHGTLDLWEAAVPDTTWRLLEEYEEAVESLTALKTSSPANLKSNLKAAEEAYVAAQLAADKSANVFQQLTAERVQRVAFQESARQGGVARLFSALRGDE